MIQNKQAIYLFTLAYYKDTLAKQNKITHTSVIVKKKGSLKNLSADCRPTDSQQSAKRPPTVSQQVFWGALLHNYQGK